MKSRYLYVGIFTILASSLYLNFHQSRIISNIESISAAHESVRHDPSFDMVEAVSQPEMPTRSVVIANSQLAHPIGPNSQAEASQVDEALTMIYSEEPGKKILGMQQLVHTSPELAVETIHSMLDRMSEDPAAEGVAAFGILTLANRPDVLTNEDLSFIYDNQENKNLKARSARVLAHRGITEPLKNYIESYADNINSKESVTKIKAITELGYLESELTIPHIKPALRDADEMVRITAISALTMSSNSSSLELIRPLLYDASVAVREKAERAIEFLISKGDGEVVPFDIQASGTEGAHSS